MKYFKLAIISLFFISATSVAQVKIRTSSLALDILQNNYNPLLYASVNSISDKDSIIDGIVDRISPDTLKANLEILQTFGTRNTGSDTISSTRGIGAARRWILSKFNQYSAQNDNRLVTGYLDFEALICGMNDHRNVYGILPGMDTTRKEIVLIEAHYDSRCEGRCDVTCDAPGMDDNGSGTVLVLELARIMSRYTFDRTIVFTTVTAEEQGLVGGAAWAKYLSNNDIPLLACLNNDVVGGVECGRTSSPPGCSPEGDIDSLNVRVFSYSKFPDTTTYSQYKQLARYIKLQQIEEINPRLSIPMNVDIRLREDRDGRGGDHIPFRREGLTSVRFSSSNEHGDGSGTSPDRQHTTTDSLGVDLDMPPNGIIDHYFVNFNYLARNAIMNGVNLALLANSPRTPEWSLNLIGDNNYEVEIDQNDLSFGEYRVGVRSLGSGTLYFDTVFTFTNTDKFTLPELRKSSMHYVSVANVEDEIESLFSEESESTLLGISHRTRTTLDLKVYPNPTNNNFTIEFENKDKVKSGTIEIYSNNGQLAHKEDIPLGEGSSYLNINSTKWNSGTYQIFLFSDEKLLGTKSVIIQPN